MNKLIVYISLFLSPFAYGQTLTLIFDTSGFQDADPVIANDMAWGVVVDTAASGFSSLSNNLLEPFSFPSFSQSVDIGNGLVFYRSSANTSGSGPPDFTDGFIGTLADLPIGSNPNANGMASGQLYGLLWFPEISAGPGDSFGFLDLQLALPAEGSTVDVSSSVNPTSADFTVVPEPSTYAAILGFLALAFVGARRMRK